MIAAHEKWQNQDDKSFASQAARLSKDVVLERWGNTAKHAKDLAQLHAYLKNHEELLKNKDDQFIREQAKKFLSSDRSEENVVVTRARVAPEKPRAAQNGVVESAPDKWRDLPKGTRFRLPTDPPDRWRTR